MLALLVDGHGMSSTILRDAELAGQTCEAAGWTQRPDWSSLANGMRAPQPLEDGLSLGEWAHGWQFHASDALEKHAYNNLLRSLALPSTRRNACSLGKARVLSCQGPFAAAWMTACPASRAMTFSDSAMQ